MIAPRTAWRTIARDQFPAATAERDLCSRPNARCTVKKLRAWLVPPVIFPFFLAVLIVTYAMVRRLP